MQLHECKHAPKTEGGGTEARSPPPLPDGAQLTAKLLAVSLQNAGIDALMEVSILRTFET